MGRGKEAVRFDQILFVGETEQPEFQEAWDWLRDPQQRGTRRSFVQRSGLLD